MKPASIVITVLLITVFAVPAVAQEVVAELFGHPLFLQRNNRELEYRTLVYADTAGKRIFRLQSPNALSAAILVKAGYRVCCRMQFKWELSTARRVGDNDRTYTRVFVSHFLILPAVEGAVEKRGNDYVTGLRFGTGGVSEYAGRSGLEDTVSAVRFEHADLATRGRSGLDPGQGIARRIDGVFVIADSSETTDRMTGAIVSAMDSLRCDVSYRVPEIRLLTGRKKF